MTQTAMVAGITPRTNIFNILFKTPNLVAKKNILIRSSRQIKENALVRWFKQSSVLASLEVKTIPAGEIFQTDLLIVKFGLSDHYRNNFVLLRGLLEFSRPKNISISSNTAEKTFQFHAAEDQAEIFTSYLDIIQRLLIQEIKFKKSLKAVLAFERVVKQEQAKLYQDLRASIQ